MNSISDSVWYRLSIVFVYARTMTSISEDVGRQSRQKVAKSECPIVAPVYLLDT